MISLVWSFIFAVFGIFALQAGDVNQMIGLFIVSAIFCVCWHLSNIYIEIKKIQEKDGLYLNAVSFGQLVEQKKRENKEKKENER